MGGEGFEPPTLSVETRCSTAELTARSWKLGRTLHIAETGAMRQKIIPDEPALLRRSQSWRSIQVGYLQGHRGTNSFVRARVRSATLSLVSGGCTPNNVQGPHRQRLAYCGNYHAFICANIELYRRRNRSRR